MPLVLVSLEGRDELSFTLQAAYTSILGNGVKRCNADAPTSILGCGFTMALSYIGMLNYHVSHNIQSDFYFVSEGGRFPLYREREKDDYILFVSVQHPLWEFRYYNKEETTKWSIFKEDGSEWVFGGNENSTEVHLAWENWVGAAAENGAVPFPTGWYLREITSINNAVISFQYENVKEPLGDNAYTRCMHLKSVVTTYGERVELCYGKKEAWEYGGCAAGQSAYQETYDDGYLDYVDVFAKNGSKMYRQQLFYDFYSINGKEEYCKRYLTSVAQITAEGKQMPSLYYHYAMDSAHCAPGSLLGMEYPLGAKVSFSYENMEFEQASGIAEIFPPQTDWECSMIHGGDFSIAKFTRGEQVCLKILYWDTGWKVFEDTSFQNELVQDMVLMAGDNFFLAFYYSVTRGKNNIYVFRRKQTRRAEWEVIEVELEASGELPAIACGNDYYAIQVQGSQILRIHQYMPLTDTWEICELATDRFDFTALGAGKGFLLGAYYQEQSRLLRFCTFYIGADGIWRQADIWDTYEDIELQLTNSFSVWSVGQSEASAAMVQVEGQDYADGTVYLLRWRENYTFADKAVYRLRQTALIKNPLLYSVVSGNVIGYAQNVFRYLPGRWMEYTLLEPHKEGEYQYAYGEDLALAVEYLSGRQHFYAIRFDAVQGKWTRENAPYSDDVCDGTICTPHIAGRYAVLGKRLFYRDNGHCWNLVYTFPDYARMDSVHMDPQGGYCLYGIKEQNMLVKLIFDGMRVEEELTLNGMCSNTSQGNCAGTDSFHIIRQDCGMQIYGLLDKYSFQTKKAVVVKEVSLDAGNGLQTYAISYEKKGIRWEWFSPLFQKVQAIPVDQKAPYGYVEYTYFNGLAEQHEDAVYPLDDEYSNARQYYSSFAGQLFRMDVYKAGKELEKSEITYSRVLDQRGYMIRPVKVVDTTFFTSYDFETQSEGECLSRESIIVNEYEETYYQIRSTVKWGYDTNGETVGVGTKFRYAWEQYEPLHQAHILNKMVYSKKFETKSDTVLEAEAVHWEQTEEGNWHEAVKLVWNGEDSAEFPQTLDVDNWNVKEHFISWNAAGLVTESIRENGNGEYSIYDQSGNIEIAHFVNAFAGQAVYCGFEPYESVNDSNKAEGSKKSEGYVDIRNASIEIKEYYSGSRCISLQGEQSIKVVLPRCQWGMPYLVRFAAKYKDNNNTTGSLKITTSGKGGCDTQSMEIPCETHMWHIFNERLDFTSELYKDTKDTMELVIEIFAPKQGRLLLDAFFLTPLLCEAEAFVYEGNMDMQCARHNNRGGGTLSMYDGLHRTVAATQENGDWRTCSRFNHGTKEEDSTISVLFSGEAKLYPMYRGNDFEADWERQPVNTAEKRTALKYKGDIGNQYGIYLALSGDYGTIKITSGAFVIEWNSLSGTVIEGGRKVKEFTLADSIDFERTTIGNTLEISDFLIIRLGKRLGMYSGDRELFLLQLEEELQQELTISTQDVANITCIGMGKKPKVTVSYMDAVGVAFQDQIVTEEGVIVTQSLYSPLRQLAIKTKPAELAGELWGYRKNLVTGFDEYTGIMKGEIADLYPEDEGYPYERTVTTYSPNPYITEMGQAGRDFAIGVKERNGHTIHFKKYIPVNLPGNYTQKGMWADCCVEASGKTTFLIYDSFDNKAMQIVRASTGESQITCYENDFLGRVCKVCPPNMFGEDGVEHSFAEQLHYDLTGNLARHCSPDIGTTRFIYDWRGRLHYEQTQDGAEEGFYIYHLYDSYDREVEVGRENGIWDEDALQKKANQNGGCSKASVWSRRFRYDGENLQQNQLGRLWQCDTRTENGIVTESFSYDEQGNVIRQTQKLLETEDVVSSVYDKQGNLLEQSVNGQEENRILYEYDLVGRLKRITAGNQEICINQYDLAGRLVSETLAPSSKQPLMRTYRYNCAGWLTNMEDTYFSQNICYRLEDGLIESMQIQIRQTPEDFLQTLDTVCQYDGFGRIKKVDILQCPQYSIGLTAPLKYDNNSNLLSGDCSRYEYQKGSNRLAAGVGNSFLYNYNAKGACIKKQTDERQMEFTYNSILNRMVKAKDDSEEILYYHGAKGVTAYETEGKITRYLRDEKGRILCEIRPDGVVCLCVYGANGILAQVWDEKVYYMLKDYQASVRAVWDGNKLCAAWNYAPLGHIMEGAFETEEARELIPFRFAGQILTIQGLYQAQNRWYDPDTGRFLSVDPEHQYNSPYLFGNCDWINYCDPDGAFSIGSFFASLASIAVGVLCVAVGIAVTVGSGGAAVPLLAVLGGAALAGFGFGVGVYGVTSLCTNEYDFWECMIYGVSGAVTGAATAGIGAALPAFTGWTAVFVDAAIGTVIGAADGVVTNGCINAYHGANFTDDWEKSLILGGVLGGIFGAASGVGRAYHNQKIVSAGSQRKIYVNYSSSRRSMNPGHASIGKTKGNGINRGTELLIDDQLIPAKKMTCIEVYNDNAGYNEMVRGRTRTAEIPVSRATYNQMTFRAVANNGSYCYIVNDCTSYVASVLSRGGFAPPLWARTPYTMYRWACMLY